MTNILIISQTLFHKDRDATQVSYQLSIEDENKHKFETYMCHIAIPNLNCFLQYYKIKTFEIIDKKEKKKIIGFLRSLRKCNFGSHSDDVTPKICFTLKKISLSAQALKP